MTTTARVVGSSELNFHSPLVVTEIEEIFLDACRQRNVPPDSPIASELKPILMSLYASGLDERKAVVQFVDTYFLRRSVS